MKSTVILLFACILVTAESFQLTSYPTGIDPTSVATGDFNGDGQTDLVFADSLGLGVYLNQGRAAFGAILRTPAAVTGRNGQLLVADFSRDGKLDVLTTQAIFFAGNGDGTFQPPVKLPIVCCAPQAVAIADLNGDGTPDLVNANNILFGSGNGTFQLGGLLFALDPTVSQISAVVTGDFDGNGSADVAVIEAARTSPASTMRIYLGDGTGRFTLSVSMSLEGSGTYVALAAADFNKDGKTDLLINRAGAFRFYRGNGDGTFEGRPAGVQPPLGSLSVGDFDNDGNPDVLFSTGQESVRLFRGLGNGSFDLSFDAYAGRYAYLLSVADLDGDGTPDAAAVAGNSVSVLIHRPGASPGVVVSAADGLARVARGSLATLYGTALTETSDVTLTVADHAGNMIPAKVLYASPTQINMEIPAGAAAGEATLIVRPAIGASRAVPFLIRAVAPSLFVRGDSYPAGFAVSADALGRQFQQPLSTCVPIPEAGFEYCDANEVKLGTQPVYFVLYGTGLRNRTSLSAVRVVIGTHILPVAYAGSGGGVDGLDQVNVLIPPEVAFLDFQPLTVVVDDVPANTVSVLID